MTRTSPFQSSPGPKAGCYGGGGGIADTTHNVSILTRPEGRVLRLPPQEMASCSSRFNPHPARRPGATGGTAFLTACGLLVSILTRPEGRVLRAD